MKCFSLHMLRRRRRCLIVGATVMALINLIFLWKVNHWSEGELELNASELSFTSKRRSLNHTPPVKTWLDHLSSLLTRKATVQPKRKEKEVSQN